MNNGKNTNAARALAMGVVAALFIVSLQGTGAALSNSGGGSWQYYKEITISYSGGALSDYQVLVQLSSSNFPTNARSDGADVRFTDNNGNELSYWIESWDYSGRSAKIWVKVPSIVGGGGAIIRMHYGNPSASSSSNGDATFEFFDDFMGTSLDTTNKWSYNGQGSIAVSNSILSMTGWTPYIYSNKLFNVTQNILESKVKEPGISNTALPGWMGDSGVTSSDVRAQYYHGYPGFEGAVWYVYDGTGRVASRSVLYDNYNILGIRIINSTLVDFYKDYSKVFSFSSLSQFLVGNSIAGMQTQLSGYSMYIDWVRVRKIASSEPTLTLGAEQPIVPPTTVPPTTVPPTIATATTTPTYTATPTPTSKPSVSLHGDKTDVVLGEDIILKLSALNLIC
ncbi:MAG: DUF2341 domain-containing protein [Candidatus Methanoperedens sp.]|nr:DUF2341 domain-containing protein [Candidatus Methanoperedens sp.]MCZ7404200.1 DUF2341 domain-containing protein [Candidatus Methanoperedens sp.]